jgi:hypothetical protein
MDKTDDKEVAVMPGTVEGSRPRVLSRLLGLLVLGPCLAGCAAMTQDVDAYYRQMASNYQEALDKAKLDAVTLQNQAKVLAMTGDQWKYRKTQRQLERLQSWEEHCAKEQKRFEKAAEWMEGRFDIKKASLGEKGPADRVEENVLSSKTSDSQATR